MTFPTGFGPPSLPPPCGHIQPALLVVTGLVWFAFGFGTHGLQQSRLAVDIVERQSLGAGGRGGGTSTVGRSEEGTVLPSPWRAPTWDLAWVRHTDSSFGRF